MREWKSTACVLCSANCGIEVRLDGRRIERVRGDKAHPASEGYTCEKALRLDHYQNGRHRLTSPMRRCPDGSYEEVDWGTAVAEVAERLGAVRDAHGGQAFLYYGGGGQGNHLGGAYGAALMKALGASYRSNALAQEKTGEFWVNGRMFGTHVSPDVEHAEVAVFVGKNPWQSHGFPRARTVLKAIANDPGRALVVIDPRRSETAEMADVHLAVRPGTDAWCLAGLAAVIVQEGLTDAAFLATYTAGTEAIDVLAGVDVPAYAVRCGVDEALLRATARRIAAADSVAVYEDLGIEQAPHSTLNSWLEKLLFVLVGSYAKPGANHAHTSFANLAGGGGPDGGAGRPTPVGGHRMLGGMVPCNAICDEVLTDHPDRFRAMVIESANPVHSLADSARMREALAACEFVLVIDVAMTETARCADYVLPASSQYEKWEATFFNFEFPRNVFHLREPLLEPLEGTLAEPEIYARLVRALGAYGDADLAPLHDAAGRGRAEFATAFFAAVGSDARLGAVAPLVLYEVLGPTLPDGAAAAASLWPLAHRCARAYPDAVARAGHGEGLAAGEALFDAILAGRSGVTFTLNTYEEAWGMLRTDDARIHLDIPELMGELRGLAGEEPPRLPDGFDVVLSAGERRSSTANTALRDPSWRKKDPHGALRVSTVDAARLGLADGAKARVTTERGSVVAVVEVTDTLQGGHASLPNGLGLSDWREPVLDGAPPNELTASGHRDWFALTPFHKWVPARLEPAT